MSLRNLFYSTPPTPPTPAAPSKTDPDEFPDPGYNSDASDDYDDYDDSDRDSVDDPNDLGSSGDDECDVENQNHLPILLPPKPTKHDVNDVNDVSEDMSPEPEPEPEPDKKPQKTYNGGELDALIRGIHADFSAELREMTQKLDEARQDLPDVSELHGTSSPRSTTDSIITDSFDLSGKKTRTCERVVYDEDTEDPDNDDSHGWSKHRKHRIRICLWKLKYNLIVSRFYLNNLRQSEEYWSWLIILISTITSGITVANNVDSEPFPEYHLIVKISLNFSSIGTALIAAWIKKKRFVETINEIDKYVLGINKLCEEIEVELALLEDDRMPYISFRKRFLPQIVHFASNNPMIPPDEWKKCVRDITLNYPELVDPDSSESGKLWPWFGDLVEKKVGEDIHHIRQPTNFMRHYLKQRNSTDKIVSSCCRKKKDYGNIYKT